MIPGLWLQLPIKVPIDEQPNLKRENKGDVLLIYPNLKQTHRQLIKWTKREFLPAMVVAAVTVVGRYLPRLRALLRWIGRQGVSPLSCNTARRA